MLNLSDREKENALNEVRILASIKHSNVAGYKQAFFDEPSSSLWYFNLLTHIALSWSLQITEMFSK
jgi:hypothetical protein